MKYYEGDGGSEDNQEMKSSVGKHEHEENKKHDPLVDDPVQEDGTRESPQQKGVDELHFGGGNKKHDRDITTWDEGDEEHRPHERHVVQAEAFEVSRYPNRS